MIAIIFGVPRVGKTALMTSFALAQMKGVAAHQDIKECRKLIAPLNNNGFNLTLPDRHLVFSDYYIDDRRGKIRSYEIDGFYLGLPNLTHPTVFLPPFSRIYLDEAQKYYNSRESQKLSDFVSRFYELHGHYRLNITMTVQRPGLIDLNIRELSTTVIEVVDLKHKYEHDRIVKSFWFCNVFDSTAKALKYIDSGRTSNFGEHTVFSYDGNIFKHYDSHNFMPAHLKDRYESDFDCVPSFKCGMNLAAIKAFNLSHDYNVPETFYKVKVKK